MTDHADVVVVGGGVLGCVAALHLAETGVGSIRLVERDGLFEGTSAAGAGFLGNWSPFEPEMAAARYGLDFYAKLQAEGDDINFRQNGVLCVAASESSWQGLHGGAEDEADPSSIAVSPRDVEQLTSSVVSGHEVYGGLLDPSGAQVYAPKVGAVLANRLRKRGGIINTRRPATGVRTRGGRVLGIETHSGMVECDAVVLATGAWGNELMRPLGVFLPIAPQITSRVITEDLEVPETMPALLLTGLVPEEPDGGTLLWVRWHDGGLLWGGTYPTHPRNILVDAPVPGRLDEIPMDGILEILRVAARGKAVMPALARRASIKVKHGAPCYTPDWRALVGPVPGIDGLYVLAGDNETGLTFGPGYAKALADHLIHGASDLTDMNDWKLDRFGDRFTTQAEVIEAFEHHQMSM